MKELRQRRFRYAEPQALSAFGRMKLTRVYLKAQDHSVATTMFETLDLDSHILFQRSQPLLKRQVMLLFVTH